MSSFYYLAFACAAIVGLAVVFFRYKHRHFKYWHVGFGMVLAWSEKLQAVIVLSRLLGSPAHNHGVHSGMILLSVDGTKLDSLETFRIWSNEFSPQHRKKTRFVFQGTEGVHHANMEPVLITSHIPVYWHPDQKPEISFRVRSCRRYCGLTGEYYHTLKLTGEALREVYF